MNNIRKAAGVEYKQRGLPIIFSLEEKNCSSYSTAMGKLLVVLIVAAVFYSCCPSPASAECADEAANRRE